MQYPWKYIPDMIQKMKNMALSHNYRHCSRGWTQGLSKHCLSLLEVPHCTDIIQTRTTIENAPLSIRIIRRRDSERSSRKHETRWQTKVVIKLSVLLDQLLSRCWEIMVSRMLVRRMAIWSVGEDQGRIVSRILLYHINLALNRKPRKLPLFNRLEWSDFVVERCRSLAMVAPAWKIDAS